MFGEIKFWRTYPITTLSCINPKKPELFFLYLIFFLVYVHSLPLSKAKRFLESFKLFHLESAGTEEIHIVKCDEIVKFKFILYWGNTINVLPQNYKNVNQLIWNLFLLEVFTHEKNILCHKLRIEFYYVLQYIVSGKPLFVQSFQK